MEAECGCRVKSYRAKQCPDCEKWFCPPCYSEHIASLEIHCSDHVPRLITGESVLPKSTVLDMFDNLVKFNSITPKKFDRIPVTCTQGRAVSKQPVFKILKKRSTEIQTKPIDISLKFEIKDASKVPSFQKLVDSLQANYIAQYVEEYEQQVMDWLDKRILLAKVAILTERKK